MTPLIAGIAPHVSRNFTAGDGCWLWRGCINPDGYGQVGVNYAKWLAHRYVYVQLVGPVPEGRELHHTCENRRCVNPAHLAAITRAEHQAASPRFLEAMQRVYADKAALTHCKHGHEYTPENTARAPDGSRRCKTCNRLQARARNGRTFGTEESLRPRGRTCSIEGCEGKHVGRGYCNAHLLRLRRTGSPCARV